MATAVASGAVTPDLIQKTCLEASMSSRTSHARVALSMTEHIQRAELYYQSHKKALVGLQLEHHQLAETTRKLDDAIHALVDQQTIAKKHADARPPYDAQSHAVMQTELVELDAGLRVLQLAVTELSTAMRDVQHRTTAISEEMNYLQAMVLRDKYITSTEVPPKADDPKLSGKVQLETLPSIFERGSSVSGCTPRRATSPRQQPPPASPRHPSPAGNPSAGKLNGLNWPSVITNTYVLCGDYAKRDAALRVRVEAQAQQVLVRCRSLRSQVVKQQLVSIDGKVKQRQSIAAEVEGLEGKIFDARHTWRTTSETVQRMKDPLKTTTARHTVRDAVEDGVGQALVDEKALLAKSRHELKKLCRSLAAQVDELEAQRHLKEREIASLDAQLREDRAHCHLENPVGIFGRQHPIKVAAIRTYPHLLSTREIMGGASSVSSSTPRIGETPVPSPRLPSQSGRSNVAPFRQCAAATTPTQQRVGTPRSDDLGAQASALPGVTGTQQSPRKIPAPPLTVR